MTEYLRRPATPKAAEPELKPLTQEQQYGSGSFSLREDQAAPKEVIDYLLADPTRLGQAMRNVSLEYPLPDGSGRKMFVKLVKLGEAYKRMSPEQLREVKAKYESGFRYMMEFYDMIVQKVGADIALHVQRSIGKKSLLNDLQITDAQLSADAFIEQLTNRASYMNDTDLDSTNKDISVKTAQKASNFQGKSLLTAFGYASEIPVFGTWGFQMRVFTPIPEGKLSDKAVLARRRALDLTVPIVVFRGTEGVQLNTTEGGMDTLVGDLARASVGELHVKMNRERIDAAIKSIKSSIFAGHSLGGGIAQIVAATHPNKVSRVVTFQSPGLPAKLAEQFTNSNHSQAHHYRVRGDIVPTAGEVMLPGNITSFERSEQAKDGSEFERAVNATSSHVAFPLTTWLQSLDAKDRSAEQVALLKYGAHDRSETETDGKAGMTWLQNRPTNRDLRATLETIRRTAVANLVAAAQLNAKMAQANLGYNLLLEAVEPRLKAATTYEQFKEVYEWLGTVQALPITQKQEELLKELHIGDKTRAIYPITHSDDPESLLPEFNIAMPDLGKGVDKKNTFLGDIDEHGGMVMILPPQVRQIQENLEIHWAGQHEGSAQAVAWRNRTVGP
ncbi:lipase family protein [Deinococcus sp.]|uniref:lipase family protein n=1 Tax=Deinococcus sp. TaxID=47478 RepID=UPI003B5C96B3